MAPGLVADEGALSSNEFSFHLLQKKLKNEYSI
jgi:hypothetical protein